MVIASVCVTAGVIVFVTTRTGHGNDSAAAPGRASHSSAASTPVGHGSSTAGAPLSTGAAGSAVPLPIAGSAGGDVEGPAQFSNPAVVSAVLAAARTGVEAINTYDYRNLNGAISAGLAATTGAFQTSYRAAMTGDVAATAPVTHTVQHCTAQRVGITSVGANLSSASVLVFGQLLTTDTTTGVTPRSTSITLGVSLQDVSGVWLISAVTDFSTGSDQAQPPGTPALYAAAVAGAQEVVNLLTFHRATYDADFARGLAGLTGAPLTEQEGQKESNLATMNTADADYLGAVRGIGIESASGDSILMLVAATSYQVSDTGQRSVLSLPRLEIGVVRINGTWLVDQFQAIGSSD